MHLEKLSVVAKAFAYTDRHSQKRKMATQRTNYGFQMLSFTLLRLLNNLFVRNIEFESLTFKDSHFIFCVNVCLFFFFISCSTN